MTTTTCFKRLYGIAMSATKGKQEHMASTQTEVNELTAKILEFTQAASDDDAVLACKGCADAAAFRLAKNNATDNLCDEMFSIMREKFTRYRQALNAIKDEIQ